MQEAIPALGDYKNWLYNPIGMQTLSPMIGDPKSSLAIQLYNILQRETTRDRFKRVMDTLDQF